ncbi:uncharacterized protein BP5553_06887 [Venustampulla echinocandica]|uniref:Uncharacterized protein n=1 Tax=Venustampulla echinocandica TaxID=2656787 RepID=A0A370TL85_9HELO|nr:uncharacterized protein BP5553_06887 [Venustampulla echinocandica]RDL36275.1 hypothetical protein BP5553_06887 [Venustampulla echinocandica]
MLENHGYGALLGLGAEEFHHKTFFNSPYSPSSSGLVEHYRYQLRDIANAGEPLKAWKSTNALTHSFRQLPPAYPFVNMGLGPSRLDMLEAKAQHMLMTTTNTRKVEIICSLVPFTDEKAQVARLMARYDLNNSSHSTVDLGALTESRVTN